MQWHITDFNQGKVIYTSWMYTSLLNSYSLFRFYWRLKRKQKIIKSIGSYGLELFFCASSYILFTAIVFFQLSINYIDLNKVDTFLQDPYSLFNITVFVKAFGYSYFLIYQVDYKFPLSIYSGVNLMVQMLLLLTVIQYYRVKDTMSN